jgi:hypothetical protein
VFTKLLPYIEENNLYQMALQQGLTGLEVPVATYISPADGSPPASPAGLTSYVANNNLFARPGNSLPRSVPDGLSNTLLFTEHYMVAGSPSWYNCWAISADGLTVQKQLRTRVARLISAAPPQFLQPQMCDPNPASSPHTSGILTALADGSVRGIAGGVAGAPTASPGSPVTNWQAVLTPAGNETLGSDW